MFYKDIIKNAMLSVLGSDTYVDFLIWKRGSFEPEIDLLPLLCDKDKISIDVGASDGIYTTHLYKLSKMCYAFEPRIDAFQRLNKIFGNAKKPIRLETLALSNVSGETTFKIFPAEYGRSTIEIENNLEKDGKVEYTKIKTTKIDDYPFDGQVGFIKIDVEGHEESVLKGAQKLISSEQPSFLIEIEDRHKLGSINSTSNLLQSYGYKGFYYKDKKLFPMQKFNLEEHQNNRNLIEGKEYFNNFIFITESILKKIEGQIIVV